jgi:hypothetical protein
MAAIPAIACFGVPERQVDLLIDAIVGTLAEPKRWFVFGQDANLLGALDQHWRTSLDLVLARMPGTGPDVHDALLLILENEGVQPEQCVWLLGPQVSCPSTDYALASLIVADQPLEALVSRLGEVAAQ